MVLAATRIEGFGADGITVHPRPDGRHIRYDDVRNLKRVLTTESECRGQPDPVVRGFGPGGRSGAGDAGAGRARRHHVECRLGHADTPGVPERRDTALPRTGHPGFDLRGPRAGDGCRGEDVRCRPGGGSIRRPYAREYPEDPARAVASYVAAAEEARRQGLGLNAGHDLRWRTCATTWSAFRGPTRVSIGHALISDALYYGLENTVGLYLRELKNVRG